MIKEFQVQVETETGRKLRVLRTDRGGEFTSVEFGLYCEGQGVELHLTAPYSPQQNGVVERRNQTVVGMARSMLKAKKMPAVFWGRGCEHDNFHPESRAHQEPEGHDAIRGLAREEAGRVLP